jgi:predicted dienelactone hydrolase
LKDFCASARTDATCQAPPEFPTLFESAEQLRKTDEEFDAALNEKKNSVRDLRVRAVFAMAPALGPAFPKDSLKSITIPVEIVAGEKDRIVPIESGARSLASEITAASLHLLADADHYVFLDTCTKKCKEILAVIYVDPPAVDRDSTHAQVLALMFEFFASKLK